MKDTLRSKNKRDLISISKELNIPINQRKRRDDIINDMLRPEHRRQLNRYFGRSFWKRYSNHIYGIITVAAFIFGIFFWMYPRSVPKDNLQIQKAMFLEIKDLFGDFNALFRKMYIDSYYKSDTLTLREFYSHSGFIKSWKYLNLECGPYRSTPSLLYDEYIATSVKLLQNEAKRILDLYSDVMEAELFQKLHIIADSNSIDTMTLINQNRPFLKKYDPQRQASLKSNTPVIEDYELDAFVYIFLAYNDAVGQLEDQNMTELSYDPVFDVNGSCRLSEAEIELDENSVPVKYKPY